ncbi:MAG: sigma-54 dependent transcriptional regulator [Desulfarculaceae bacterium]|nr:sigma-54 dependent transcriptional regulator [Desulfarculaceae bacterium]MCF8074306.1 sigma-54 dependent transcriptional regulator [Desulfarculaceae bacterium]MCF8103374.1 sigma-54 dependent transcriptional regulator [Desulfarculaceae bacterium]MCF8117771.1 sigma-54 dependent transcriptional regulator [Desulfarculaceae bacterium]
MYRVLIAEPDGLLREKLERLAMDQGCRVGLAEDTDQALAEIQASSPDLVLLSASLPPAGGLEFLARLKQSEPRLPVIVTGNHGAATSQTIEATKLGAFDYVALPYDPPDMAALLRSALEAGRFMRSPVQLEGEEPPAYSAGDALLGSSRPMQELYKAIGRAAATDATVLIQGESGTGKELVARALFQHSTRADKPFVVVNCVAIPETLLESELFGYEKGAFTGAGARRIGKIEQADRGTVFLDEIGDMPLAIQAKMLRLLQERSVERIGARQPQAVDVRILAATNRDLAQAVQAGRFREDLYYRLNVVPITVPPLRERREDVPLLCDYFLGRVTRDLGVRNPGITPEAYELLSAHHWPGNVRELANAMEKCLIFGRGRPVGDEEVASLVLGQEEGGTVSLSPEVDQALRSWVRRGIASGRPKLLEELLGRVERIMVSEALETTGGVRTHAAAMLGLSRPSLLARMKKYGLS